MILLDISNNLYNSSSMKRKWIVMLACYVVGNAGRIEGTHESGD